MDRRPSLQKSLPPTRYQRPTDRRLSGLSRRSVHPLFLFACFTGTGTAVGGEPIPDATSVDRNTRRAAAVAHREVPRDPWIPRPEFTPLGSIEHCGAWERGPFRSVQVNVDEKGCNIVGDAANEPSIAIDPTDPTRMVIGWRQFDSVLSGFRQAGWAYSPDGGESWTFPGVLEEGVFRSDPVLDADAEGDFYYYSLQGDFHCDLFISVDGGVSWLEPVWAAGGDKPWMTIDRTEGIGRGHIYAGWSASFSCCEDASFLRSIDGAQSFDLLDLRASWGTMAVGADGTLYVSGNTNVSRSDNAKDADVDPTFVRLPSPGFGGLLDGTLQYGGWPNPDGLLGQSWVAVDTSGGSGHGNVYLLASVDPPGEPWWLQEDPLDVRFARSTDRGVTWSDAVRVNDDERGTGAWQWFGTMSVAPTGRIDAVWNDTRNDPEADFSELYYSYSTDQGETWSKNIPVSPPFNHFLGYPRQGKLGDYYHMRSDAAGADVAYAATFNGEQDIYYLRIEFDCNANGIHDGDDVARNGDCNGNVVPDECDIASGASADADSDGVPDECRAAVLYVKADAGGQNQGTTWEDAYTDLQQALQVARGPDSQVAEIWVAEGLYRPGETGGSRRSSFAMVSGVTLYGGFAGSETHRHQRNWTRHPTVLSGDLNGDDPPFVGSFCCFDTDVCDVPECAEAVCEVDPQCCEFGWANRCAELARELCPHCSGASGARREDNVFHVVTAIGTDETAVLDGFVIKGGNSDSEFSFANPLAEGFGAGLFIRDGNATARNCMFRENLSDFGGTIGTFARGAYHGPSATFTAVNCLIVSNSGVAVQIYAPGNSSLINSSIIRNWTDCDFCPTAIDNSSGDTTSLHNCIVRENFYRYYHPENALWYGTGSSLVAYYSSLEGWAIPENGSTAADPLFRDPIGPDGIPATGDEDYRLSAGSPCIDAGDNGAIPDGIVADLDGWPRLQDDPATADGGNGDPPIVDMGAFEFQPLSIDIQPGICPNTVSSDPRRRDTVEVAVVGAPGVELWRLNLASLGLARADGVGRPVAPLRNRRGRYRVRFEDVATPVSGPACTCHDAEADGTMDRVLTISARELADAFDLASEEPGANLPVTLRGRLIDGTAFTAFDCVSVAPTRSRAAPIQTMDKR